MVEVSRGILGNDPVAGRVRDGEVHVRLVLYAAREESDELVEPPVYEQTRAAGVKGITKARSREAVCVRVDGKGCEHFFPRP
eukprot:4194695-Pleurochrysis_carterae.AAC.1